MYNLEKDINNVLSKYSLLKYNSISQKVYGEIEILGESGKFIDIFNVQIILPSHFPKCFPKVIETEQKIPRKIIRHVMPKTNHLCLAVQFEEILLCSKGITLLWFIDKVLVPRLAEEFRVNNGEKYQKEYSHDFGGTWEFLMKKLDLKTPDLVLKFIEALANKKKPNGNSLCLCGSKELYRLCHKKQVLNILQLNNKLLKLLYTQLLNNPYKGINL